MTCSSNSHVSLILSLLAQIQVGSWYQGTNLVDDVIAITLITSVRQLVNYNRLITRDSCSKGYYKHNKILARLHTELLVECSCVENNANSIRKRDTNSLLTRKELNLTTIITWKNLTNYLLEMCTYLQAWTSDINYFTVTITLLQQTAPINSYCV